MRRFSFLQTPLLLAMITVSANGQWIDFQDRTSTRLVIATGADAQEKDCGVGDFDLDGWEDVVVVRKEAFKTKGGDTDLLLMNRSGILTDETAALAPQFLTNLSDARDVFVSDIDGDNWLDLIIANTFGQQPVCYMNRGEDAEGNWLGFIDESATRFPKLTIPDLQFCAVCAADITGDGAPEIYFSNYVRAPDIALDVLLLNDGSGHFSDASDERLGLLRQSAFGTSVDIRDIDNDDDLDIIKTSSLNSVPPWNEIGVFILFNDGTGHYNSFQPVPTESPYMFAVDDLNNDELLDLYIVNDSQDYTVLNAGFDAGRPDPVLFDKFVLDSPRTTFLGGNLSCVDLDNDGDLDVAIADVDIDIGICETSPSSPRKFALLQNQGDATGTLIDSWGSESNVWNSNVFDFAVLDINRDGKLDFFLAGCSEYTVLMQEHTVGVTPQAVVFEEALVGGMEERTLRLCNNGNVPIELTELSIAEPHFSCNLNSISLDAYECREVTISFAPLSPGDYTGTLRIAGDLDKEVMLTGSAFTPPEAAVNVEPVEIQLAEGSSTSREITLSNLGGSDLEFQIRISGPDLVPDRIILFAEPTVEPLIADILSSFDNQHNVADLESITDVSFENFETIILGLTSGQVGSEAIAALTRAVHSGKTLIILGGTSDPDFLDGLQAGLLDHGGSFAWTPPASPHFQIADSNHPLSDGLPAMLDFSFTSASWYRIRPEDPDAWIAAINGDGVPCLLSKQIGAGSLIYFTNWPLGVVWDNEIDRPIFETIIANAVGSANTAWLSIRPRTGTLPPGESKSISIALNTIGQPPGSYNAELIMTSNEPGRSEIVIPISLRINSLTIPASLDLVSVLGNSVTLSFRGEPGVTYEVQRSADLLNWEPVSEFTASDTPTALVDSREPDTRWTFYQVTQLAD